MEGSYGCPEPMNPDVTGGIPIGGDAPLGQLEMRKRLPHPPQDERDVFGAEPVLGHQMCCVGGQLHGVAGQTAARVFHLPLSGSLPARTSTAAAQSERKEYAETFAPKLSIGSTLLTQRLPPSS